LSYSTSNVVARRSRHQTRYKKAVWTRTIARQKETKPAADVALSRKEIHEAGQIRDAEKRDPGVVRRAVDAAISEGKVPTKARVRKAVARIGDNLPSVCKQNSARRAG
jgi:hypothetical protein